MSVKRLTGRKEDGHAYVIGCPEFEVPKEANTVLQSVADKCADLEDILGDTYDLDRLRELVEADKDGRCVVLPCKEGDLVYWSLNGNLYETSFRLSALKYFGKYVFDTREAAEAALAKEAGRS